jgi:hypothetical protein
MKKHGWRLLLGALSLSALAAAVFFIWFHNFSGKKEYFLVNHYSRSGRCDLIDRSGKVLLSLQGNFCFFFRDGSYITAVDGSDKSDSGVYRFGPDGNLAWQQLANLSHDAYLDRANSEFFLIVQRRQDNKRRKDLTNEFVLVLDLDGRKVWTWHTADHLDELEEISRRLRGKSLEYWPEEIDQKKGMFKFTHLNTVLPLPPNKIGEKDSRFRPRNVLLNCWHTGLVFIIDRDSKKIVWSHHFPKPVHGVRMDKEGTLYFFANKNNDPGLPVKRSYVGAMNPLTGEQWRIFPRADSGIEMYSNVMGSLELAENGNMVATSSVEGKAYEFDPSGKVLWSWANPELEQGKPQLTYRVSAVAPAEAEKILENWVSL